MLTALLSLCGCPLPDPAPDELSDLLTFSFAHYTPEAWGNDISLADAALNLDTWYREDVESSEEFDFDAGFEARLTEPGQRLSNEDLAHLVPQPEVVDGPSAVGVIVALETRCSLDEVAAVYLADNQMDYFPDNYVAYSRSDHQDIACFEAGECVEARWTTHLTQEQSFPAATWDASFFNAIRRLDAQAPEGQDVRALMSQVWMDAPADIVPAGLGQLIQNYQLEFTIERPTGGSLHVYPQWVHFNLGELNTEAAVFLSAYIDGIRDYLRTLETHCADD